MLKTSQYTSLLVIYCGVIFYLSHQPTLPVNQLFMHQDKLIHAFAYAVMGMLAFQSFTSQRNNTALIAILFCSLYGISDEFHQSFIEGRDADVLDWFADTTGAAIAVVLMKIRGDYAGRN